MSKKFIKSIISFIVFVSIIIASNVMVGAITDDCEHAYIITDCQEGGRATCKYCGEVDRTVWHEPQEHILIEIGREEIVDCHGGYIFYKCENCTSGISIYYEDPQYPHDWVEIDRENATCANEGYIDFRCEYCRRGKRETILSTGEHNYYWASNHDANCTEDGTKTLCCENCELQDVETIIDEGSALGHDYTEKWTVLTTATCSQTGVSIRICKRCFDVETLTQAAYGHKDENKDNKCDDCLCLLSDASNVPIEPEDNKGQVNVFVFITNLFNHIIDFFKTLLNI